MILLSRIQPQIYWEPEWGIFIYALETFGKIRLIVRPLPVPELPVKSDGIYRATLWLRNPGHSHRLHN